MKVHLWTIAVWMGLVSLVVAQPAERGGLGPDGGSAESEYGRGPGGPGGPPPNAMFSAIDADGDGTITMRELRKAVVALKQLDTDKDGKITQAEAMGGPPNPEAMIDRVMENDKNGDGKLSKNEIPRHLAQMLAGADTNGDGTIDRAEVAACMQGARQGIGGTAGGANGSNSFAGGAGGDPRPGGPNLMQFDRNGDGQLSADEVPAQMMGLVRGADQNHNGTLDAQELQAIQQRINERVRGDRPLPPGVMVGPQGVTGVPQKP
jgi:EF hand